MSNYDETLHKYTNDIKKAATDKKIAVQSARAGRGAANVHPEKIRKEVADRVDHLFSAFYGMPDPDDYQPMIQQLKNAMDSLSSGDDGEKDPLDNYHSPPGNPQMLYVTTAATTLLDEWTGAAASEFHNNFASKFEITAKNNFKLISAMKATVVMQQAVWYETRKSIDNIAHKTLETIDGVSTYSPWPKSMSFTLSVIGAVGAVAGLPASALMAGVFTAASAVGKTISDANKEFDERKTSVVNRHRWMPY